MSLHHEKPSVANLQEGLLGLSLQVWVEVHLASPRTSARKRADSLREISSKGVHFSVKPKIVVLE